MCTPEETYKEANKAVNDVLFTPDNAGHTRFAREVHDAVFEEGVNCEPSRFQRELKKGFYQTFGKWFFGGGALVLLALAGMYFQLRENTEAIDEGGRYTEQDAIEDNRLQEGRDTRQDEDIRDLREETNEKFDTINVKLDQLIQRLIP